MIRNQQGHHKFKSLANCLRSKYKVVKKTKLQLYDGREQSVGSFPLQVQS